ncbi:MAG: hypothetical protein MZU91_05450 [Desulfosudis oleivorans]|nr:hypothetical protein [Desulfosudis oleivorans]
MRSPLDARYTLRAASASSAASWPVSLKNIDSSFLRRAAGCFTQLFHGADGNQRPLVDNADPVAHFLGDFQRVRGHKHCSAGLTQPAKNSFNQFCPSGSSPTIGSSTIKHTRPVNQCRCHDQALLHAVGKAFNKLVAVIMHLKKLEHMLYSLFPFLRLNAVQPADEAQNSLPVSFP